MRELAARAEERTRGLRGPVTEAVLGALDPRTAAERLGGINVLERQLFTLSRAGIRKAWVSADRPAPGALRLPDRLEVLWAAAPEGADGAAWVSGGHLFRVDALRQALAGGAPGRELVDSEGAQLLLLPGEESRAPGRAPFPAGAAAAVRTPEERRKALPWLLEGLRKGQDGFMARHFDRRISLTLTRALLDTPVRPNHMTLLSTGIGLAGALQFVAGDHAHAVAGALLVWLHTVLDGCDGEMARLTFRESRFGRLLDFWGDNLVHLALFASLGFGGSAESPRAAILGAAACLGALVSAWLASRQLNAPPAPAGGPRPSRLKRLETILAQRDFIYLLVLASLLNREEWFLWAAGLGAPLYGVLLVFKIR